MPRKTTEVKSKGWPPMSEACLWLSPRLALDHLHGFHLPNSPWPLLACTYLLPLEILSISVVYLSIPSIQFLLPALIHTRQGSSRDGQARVPGHEDWHEQQRAAPVRSEGVRHGRPEAGQWCCLVGWIGLWHQFPQMGRVPCCNVSCDGFSCSSPWLACCCLIWLVLLAYLHWVLTFDLCQFISFQDLLNSLNSFLWIMTKIGFDVRVKLIFLYESIVCLTMDNKTLYEERVCLILFVI